MHKPEHHKKSESNLDEGVRDKRKALVEKQIMEQACLLFAEKGYGGTTLTDIAETVGLTRAAIYYYFRNKENLLEAIMEDVTSAPIREIADWAETAPNESGGRLKSFVEMRIRGVLSRQAQMRVMEVAEAALPAELAQRHKAGKRRILEEYRNIIKEGMLRGEFRAQDDRVAALAIIGMVNWTASWFTAGRGKELDEVAAQIANMALQSVIMPQSRNASFVDAPTAIQTLRNDLDQLALLINQDKA